MRSWRLNICVLMILIIGIGAVWAFVCNQRPIYASEITIDKSFAEVWNWLSDPLRYDKLYPHWIKKISASSDGMFRVDDQFGQSYTMKLVINREFGVIDLHIDLPSGEEVSRARIYSLAPGNTAIMHIARRWKGANPIVWFFHKRNTDRDFENAKRVIEGNG